ncbi:MAG: tetratricopeptide repeat protein [Tannerellaceae bacterium]|jgi:tetratricopeptide (TPR) repeat protein|nr:tetratricopeptide repeat protein [Tannerellaceae bacterium]
MMSKYIYYIVPLALAVFAAGCGTSKNTKAHRAYHALNSRYNIYYNGKTSFDESLTAMEKGYKESYTEMILMHAVSAQPKDKATTGGAFDRAIEKGNKAIKLHSIQIKPPRKPGWRNNPKLATFYEQEEYNPFLKRCWMMVGEGQFYNADFLQASSTFSYIARHYATDAQMVAAARIWQARCYTELEWLYEAEDILRKLNTQGFPASERHLYDATYTAYLLANGQLEEAVPYLESAVKGKGGSRLQRTRMRYLLGQLYAEQGLDGLAYKAFGSVIASNPPYELEFAARIRQTEVFPSKDTRKIVRMLEGMARQDKNKNYVEQVYYALGNIHIAGGDTTLAIAAYETGIEKSEQAAMDKALIWLKLGEIFFERRDYIKAQPCFSGAAGIISKEYKDYERISALSATLDELVVHAEAIHLQDSLQELARMPEAERLARIDGIIEHLIKEEEAAKKEAEKEAYLADQAASGSAFQSQMPGANVPGAPVTGRAEEGGFYFYSPQVVSQGKAAFQQKWGRRTLEDDWRRKNKKMATFDGTSGSPADNAVAADSTMAASDSTALAAADSLLSDPKSREFYLQQIPFTEEEVEASNLIIVDGMYNIGLIYKDKLDNVDLSVEAFEELERRFPDNEHLAECYYQIYLMALRVRNSELAELYRSKMLAGFPDNDYSIAIADPDYEYNMRSMDSVQIAAYEAAYTAYLNEDTTAVHAAYHQIGAQYPLAVLLPKFMFLHALAYVQQNDAEEFQNVLKALLDKYPKADVTELAGDMLKGLLRGREIVQGGIKGMVWNMRFGDDGSLSAADSARTFSGDTNLPSRVTLMYSGGRVDRNRLLFIVAAYNFANLMVKELDMTFDEAGPVQMLTISGFTNFAEALQYYNMIHAEGGYASSLGRDIAVLPITDANYETLMRGKTMDEYIDFIEETLGNDAAALVARLRARIDSASMEEEAAEEEAAVQSSQPAAPIEPSDSAVASPAPLAPDSIAPVGGDAIRRDTVNTAMTPHLQADSIAAPPALSPDSIALKPLSPPATEKPKTPEQIRKERERAYKERQKQRARELKEKERAYKQKLRDREKARRQ